MDLLIAEPLEAEVLQWLDARHELFYAPRLAQDRRVFLDALSQARGVMLPPHLAIDQRVLAQSPRLRVIGRIVGGHENIDLSACTRAGVEVVRCIEAAAPAEAEFLLGALLALLRPSPEEMGRVAGRELGTSTVGLIGMNATARTVAKMVQPLGTRVVGYDPALHASDGAWPRWGIQPLGLRELFESCDAVCVQMSYFSRYRGLLGERTLNHAKQGQVLVSVSPLELFDEELLAQALTAGQLTAAWMDNISPTALEPGQPLHGVRGLLATPRLAAYTREARVRSAWGVAKQVDEVLRTAPQAPRPGTRRQAAAAESAQRAAGVNGHMPSPEPRTMPSHLQGSAAQAPDPAAAAAAANGSARLRPSERAGLSA